MIILGHALLFSFVDIGSFGRTWPGPGDPGREPIVVGALFAF